jgi:hypothetical protein
MNRRFRLAKLGIKLVYPFMLKQNFNNLRLAITCYFSSITI